MSQVASQRVQSSSRLRGGVGREIAPSAAERACNRAGTGLQRDWLGEPYRYELSSPRGNPRQRAVVNQRSDSGPLCFMLNGQKTPRPVGYCARIGPATPKGAAATTRLADWATDTTSTRLEVGVVLSRRRRWERRGHSSQTQWMRVIAQGATPAAGGKGSHGRARWCWDDPFCDSLPTTKRLGALYSGGRRTAVCVN